MWVCAAARAQMHVHSAQLCTFLLVNARGKGVHEHAEQCARGGISARALYGQTVYL